jgi:hypothetical protein
MPQSSPVWIWQCDANWYAPGIHQLHQLQSVLNAGIHLVYRANKHDYVIALLRELHSPPVPQSISLNLPRFFTAVNMEPPIISDILYSVPTIIFGDRGVRCRSTLKYAAIRHSRCYSGL